MTLCAFQSRVPLLSTTLCLESLKPIVIFFCSKEESGPFSKGDNYV